jgi:hypothetical protein
VPAPVQRMDDLFSAKWWRRDVAIAWVLTRDRGFTQEQHDRGPRITALDVAYALHSPRQEGVTSWHAWETLQIEAVAGRVRVAGKPVEVLKDTSGNSQSTMQARRLIDELELEDLIVHQDSGREYLIDKNWQVSRGSDWSRFRGFADVEIDTAQVMKAFPEMGEPPGWRSERDSNSWYGGWQWRSNQSPPIVSAKREFFRKQPETFRHSAPKIA